MTIFTIIAAVMILLALALLAPALLRKRQLAASDRDQQNVIIARERLVEMEADLAAEKITQDEFDLAKMELEQALLQDLEKGEVRDRGSVVSGKLTLGAIAVALPLLVISMYATLGAPGLIESGPGAQASHSSGNPQGAMPSVEEMLARLKQRLQQNPDDAKGWFMLGRSYMALNDYPEAVRAYEALLKLTGEEPTVMLSLADAVAMVQDGNMQGRPAELIGKALKADPNNQTALWMGGIMESQKGNYSQAISYWKKLESMMGDQPEALEKLRSMIAVIEDKAAETAPTK
ncbi:MAG: c-type cytochrome biogenesis protein CcmI [Gammaproteobacteria bacterium]